MLSQNRKKVVPIRLGNTFGSVVVFGIHNVVLLLIEKVIEIVINADAGIFKVSPFYGLDVITFAQSLQDKQTFPKGNEL
jgi:hypothetical protein